MAEQQNVTPMNPPLASRSHAGMTERDLIAGFERILDAPPELAPEDSSAEQEANAKAKPAPREEAPAPEAEGEPETEAEPQAEAEEAEAEPQEAADAESEVEVADTFDGLAEQLGVDPKELSEHVKVTVKVDGKTKTVSLNEALGGFQLESAYRQKSSALAEERRTFEQERESFNSKRQQDAEALAAILQYAENLIAGEQHAIDPSLRETDDIEYMRQTHRVRERREQLGELYGQLGKMLQAQQTEQQQKMQGYLADQARQLGELMPEWAADPAKGAKAVTETRDWARNQYGFTADEVNQMMDARVLKAFADLRRLTDQQGKAPLARKKLKTLPKAIKPGAGRDAQEDNRDRVADAANRFRRTGGKDTEAGVEYLKRAGIV